MEYEEAKLRSEFMMWNWKLHNQPAWTQKLLWEWLDIEKLPWCIHMWMDTSYCKKKKKSESSSLIFDEILKSRSTLPNNPFKCSKDHSESKIKILLGHLACVKNSEPHYLRSDSRHVTNVLQIFWCRYFNQIVNFLQRENCSYTQNTCTRFYTNKEGKH